ncbi:MAG: hypothetical protein IBX68_07785 [Dehalococcoidia bacterium]|nr:hypothetical protein [Dehalococcoidia bacterium]
MHEKYGIYLNTREKKVMRITSPYWIPSGNDWIMLTKEVNSTLLTIRDIAREKGIGDADSIVWGDWSEVPRKE